LLFHVKPNPNYPISSEELTEQVDTLVNDEGGMATHKTEFDYGSLFSMLDDESMLNFHELTQEAHRFDLTDEERVTLRLDRGIVTNSIELKTIHPLSDYESLSKAQIDKHDLIGFVHSGAYAYKKILFSRFLEPSIDYCLKNNLFADNLIEKGIFGVPATSSVGVSLYGMLTAMTQRSTQKRLMLYSAIRRIFEKQFHCNVSLINDVPHSGLFVDSSDGIRKLTVTRGVQLLSRRATPVRASLRLVAGQRETISALSIAGNYCAKYGHLVSHGTSYKIVSGFKYDESFCARERHDYVALAENALYNTTPNMKECIPLTFNFKIMMDYFTKVGLIQNVAILAPFVNVQNRTQRPF
jgi:hypothetical protein